MKKILILICTLNLSFLGFSQDESSIVMNDSLVKQYFIEYIRLSKEVGLDVQDKLLKEIDYILIVPEDVNVLELAETDSRIKLIKLSSDVRIDRLILKVNLFRELSHILGAPYDEGSIIMFRKKGYGFSYAFADDIDIMQIEIFRILSTVYK